MDKKLISISLTFCVLICLSVVGYGIYKNTQLNSPTETNVTESTQFISTQPQTSEELIAEPTINADIEIIEEIVENNLNHIPSIGG